MNCLEESFENVEHVGLMRKYFNAEDGLDFISQLIVDDEEKRPTLTTVKPKYFALSACSALFKYLELKCHTVFPASSLRIRYVALEGTMFIDQDTIVNLELIQNVLDPRSKQSLLGLLNSCTTKMATRLLRTSIVNPSVDIATIENRLDSVNELVQKEGKYHAIRKALSPYVGQERSVTELISPLFVNSLSSVDCDKLIGS